MFVVCYCWSFLLIHVFDPVRKSVHYLVKIPVYSLLDLLMYKSMNLSLPLTLLKQQDRVGPISLEWTRSKTLISNQPGEGWLRVNELFIRMANMQLGEWKTAIVASSDMQPQCTNTTPGTMTECALQGTGNLTTLINSLPVQ